MTNTNGHGPKTAVLYARVSTDEQARSGYSLAQQIEALRDYAVTEGYEVLEEISDPGQSGASLERPGMDRVRDLVTEGGVSVVLAQDRDCFSREPAYHHLLRREFEEHGTKIRALNDRGDDSPEGELTDGILDQLAKFERAKITERTRRGKLQKARQGKVVAGPRPNFGFRYNEARDNYVVDEGSMSVIRRIFREVGAEGRSMSSLRMALNREGVRAPSGGRFWSPKYIRSCVQDDVYRSHSFDEVAALVSAEVAAGLDPDRRYGVWWFNRRRYEVKQVAEVAPDGTGRRYRRRTKLYDKPRSEWVAVPVPDPGIPREWVDAAREAIKDNVRPSANADRVWQLSGGVLRCAGCGCRMGAHTTNDGKGGGRKYFYYRCPTRGRHGPHHACVNGRHYRAEPLEDYVWGFVAGLLKDPDRLRAGLERMVEREGASSRGNPDEEVRAWVERLGQIDRKRSGFQDVAAEGLITIDELRAKLAALEEGRKTATAEVERIRERAERARALESDKEALLRTYSAMVPAGLDALDPDERRRVYGMLRLKVEVAPDGAMHARGILSEPLDAAREGGAPLRENGLAPPRWFTRNARETDNRRHAKRLEESGKGHLGALGMDGASPAALAAGSAKLGRYDAPDRRARGEAPRGDRGRGQHLPRC